MRWIYQDLGVLLDTVFIFLQDKIPENSDDVGVVAVFLYGLGDVPLSIITSMPATPAVIVGNTLIVVPELSRLLRYSTIVASTEGISLVVLAAIDGVFYTGRQSPASSVR